MQNLCFHGNSSACKVRKAEDLVLDMGDRHLLSYILDHIVESNLYKMLAYSTAIFSDKKSV